ncbi:MAG: heme exporter protein CcmD [Thalassobaculaceae bacterium]|nr:heme exporter protein CcmD [Thalassobaculaceae bacterium]
MDYFSMGGYAAYVWPSYGFAAIVLVGLLVSSWIAARRREAEVEQLRARGADIRRRASGEAGEAR